MTSRPVAVLAAVVAGLCCMGPAAAQREERRPVIVPPVMDFTPPPAGTYRLPVIQAAPDGNVLDEDGRPHRLAEYTRGRVTLLALVYASCTDPTGCPLAHAAALTLQERILADERLHGLARFVSLSFDPRNDTPAAMRAYGGKNRRADGPLPWRFLTTRSVKELAPILDGLGQEIEPEKPGRGQRRRTINHMLKLFLIDRDGRVREIYSTAFLHPEAMLNDIRTLVMEDDVPTAALGLPPLSVPADNPVTPAKAALGKKLFFDRRLSSNGTMSCAMCHLPEQGFTSNELATSVGIEGRTVRRNAPTLLNVLFQRRLFHDGREAVLEDQIWGPLLAANEMGNPSIDDILGRIRSLADYGGLFERAFDGGAVSALRLGQALAAYQRTLVAGDSRFDRWRYGGDASALTESEKRGFELFVGRARCAGCHTVGEHDALFTDHGFHNTGVGWRRTHGAQERTRVELAPGVFAELDRKTIETVSEPPVTDVGRYEITRDPRDRWAYKTPSLRNVALTAPYMHDGSLPTLEAVIEFYDGGGVDNPEKSPLLTRLGLAAGERAALAAFLRALTGSGVRALADDARRAPIRP